LNQRPLGPEPVGSSGSERKSKLLRWLWIAHLAHFTQIARRNPQFAHFTLPNPAGSPAPVLHAPAKCPRLPFLPVAVGRRMRVPGPHRATARKMRPGPQEAASGRGKGISSAILEPEGAGGGSAFKCSCAAGGVSDANNSLALGAPHGGASCRYLADTCYRRSLGAERQRRPCSQK
jgi:hypothetical protein